MMTAQLKDLQRRIDGLRNLAAVIDSEKSAITTADLAKRLDIAVDRIACAMDVIGELIAAQSGHDWRQD